MLTETDLRLPPIILQGPHNQTLPLNTAALLVCSATGLPQPTIHWYRNERLVSKRDSRFSLVDNGALQISGNFTSSFYAFSEILFNYCYQTDK